MFDTIFERILTALSFDKEGPQNRKCCFSNKEHSLIHNLNFMKHKLVYSSFLESASNGISFGIN